jgi:SsrA-binding protein
VAEKQQPNYKVVADNRRARFNYEIGETFDAGLALTGTEVKSLRSGKATIAESYVQVDRKGEAWLVNANIPEYFAGNRFNHEPKRPRKLLLKQRELAKLAQGAEREGMTIVPLRIYFNARGMAKLQLALARKGLTPSAVALLWAPEKNEKAAGPVRTAAFYVGVAEADGLNLTPRVPHLLAQRRPSERAYGAPDSAACVRRAHLGRGQFVRRDG